MSDIIEYLNAVREPSVMKSSKSQKPESHPKPEPGDILLFHRARKWNRLITWFTKSPYYHAAIYAGDNHVVEARPRGVVCRDLNGPDGDKEFDVVPAPAGKGRDALDWAKMQLGSKYDNIGVATIVMDRICSSLHLSRQCEDKFSCGELVALAFEKAGVQMFPDREASEIVPADFTPMLPAKLRQKREKEETKA
ncbi:MAG TPA: hypothetical protein VM821_00935 [Abditibacteriaceae bacterium]|nr:hypothetical protein [Abditibacteriaceae bacterium]